MLILAILSIKALNIHIQKRTALVRCRPFALRYYFFLRALICLYKYRLLLRTTCALHIVGFVGDFLQQFSN